VPYGRGLADHDEKADACDGAVDGDETDGEVGDPRSVDRRGPLGLRVGAAVVHGGAHRNYHRTRRYIAYTPS
jgi:hypothetical protein